LSVVGETDVILASFGVGPPGTLGNGLGASPQMARTEDDRFLWETRARGCWLFLRHHKPGRFTRWVHNTLRAVRGETGHPQRQVVAGSRVASSWASPGERTSDPGNATRPCKMGFATRLHFRSERGWKNADPVTRESQRSARIELQVSTNFSGSSGEKAMLLKRPRLFDSKTWRHKSERSSFIPDVKPFRPLKTEGRTSMARISPTGTTTV
jgi:hypothetical protein